MRSKSACIVIGAAVLLGLVLLLNCERSTPSMPGAPKPADGPHHQLTSGTFWPCSTVAQIDSAFKNCDSGDTIRIYGETTYLFEDSLYTFTNTSLTIIGDGRSTVIQHTGGSSSDWFLKFNYTYEQIENVSILIKDIKFHSVDQSTYASLLQARAPTITLDNIETQCECNQSIVFLAQNVTINNSDFWVDYGSNMHLRNFGYDNGIFYVYCDATFNVENSSFTKYTETTSPHVYINEDFASVGATFDGCDFFDNDTTFLDVRTVGNQGAPGSLTLNLTGNDINNDRVRCTCIGGDNADLEITYDGNSETVGECYEDVLSTLCPNNGNCTPEIHLKNWIYDNVTYGEDMFSNIGWSDDVENCQVTLTWQTDDVSCIGRAEIFTGQDCDTGSLDTTVVESSATTNHSVTFNIEEYGYCSARIYAQISGCDSLIAEGSCHNHEVQAPQITFSNIEWSDNTGLCTASVSWKTNISCKGRATVYSNTTCQGAVYGTYYDNDVDTLHSVTFDASAGPDYSANLAGKTDCSDWAEGDSCYSHSIDPPTISFSNINFYKNPITCTITLTWDTDISCQGKVVIYSGTTCQTYSTTRYDYDYDTSHSVTWGVSPHTHWSVRIYGKKSCTDWIAEGNCHSTYIKTCVSQ